jgi:hypothetical protein
LLMTLTFEHTCLEKSEAERHLRPVIDRLRRMGIVFIVVWQRQRKRGLKEGNAGSWHAHILVNRRWLDVRDWRSFVVARGWGAQSPDLLMVGKGSYRFQTTDKLVTYLCRYLTRDYATEERRVHLSGGSRSARAGTVKFGWVGGDARAWRVGCELFVTVTGFAPGWKDRFTVFQYGRTELGTYFAPEPAPT